MRNLPKLKGNKRGLTAEGNNKIQQKNGRDIKFSLYI